MFEYDYFYIRAATIAWFISHRLAMHLLEEKITGISITPFEQGELFSTESLYEKIERKAIRK